MAHIETGGIKIRRAGVRRTRKPFPKTDMTPMVDLGFLLITFFVFTTTITQPHETTLVVPKGPVATSNLGESVALTVLLEENDQIIYYHGKWDPALANGTLSHTNFDENNGLGKIIREKQLALDQNQKIEGGRNDMMLIIKPGNKSTYKNFVDALDEVMINQVKKYAIVDISHPEAQYLATH
jgi:biopolymer transport protein ExbD